ncbi:TPA: hypothetical protein G9E65_004286 [Salmonella enterica]|nr:hypothetical protein [Salmonella enterica subsp. enterica serovar Miami]HAF1447543.1 hypothetical protein [Salmonella enterica]HAF6188620.1 hypothetical protein [Salmonella enterica]HDC2639206.1 hypothetical protein [Salmonella enterica]
MEYRIITTTIENHIVTLLTDNIYTQQQRQAYAYGAYLTWLALVGDEFIPDDDRRLWEQVRYR